LGDLGCCFRHYSETLTTYLSYIIRSQLITDYPIVAGEPAANCVVLIPNEREKTLLDILMCNYLRPADGRFA